MSGNSEVVPSTATNLQVKFQITLSAVLDAYFDTPSDTLYVVFVRQPMEISASILCTYKITDVNDAFDSTSYITYDAQGRPLEVRNILHMLNFLSHFGGLITSRA